VSIESRCPSCAMGKHERHDRDFGIIEGCIGGTYCGCTGNCAAEFKAVGDTFAAALGLLPPEVSP
jgi:hypothetical protein